MITLRDFIRSEISKIPALTGDPVGAPDREVLEPEGDRPAAGLRTLTDGWGRQTSVCSLKDHNGVKLHGNTLTTTGFHSTLPSK